MNGMSMGGMPEPLERGRRGQGSGMKLLSWLFKITGCRLRSAVYILFACSLMAILSILVPSLIGQAIDRFYEPPLTMRVIVVLAVFDLLIALLGSWQGIAIPRLTQNISHRLRRMLHEKLMQLPVSYVDAHPHGDLMSRLTNDSENIVQSLCQSIPGMISSLITLLGCVFIMLRSSPAIALFNLLTGVVALLPCSLISRRIFGAAAAQQQALGSLTAEVTDG